MAVNGIAKSCEWEVFVNTVAADALVLQYPLIPCLILNTSCLYLEHPQELKSISMTNDLVGTG